MMTTNIDYDALKKRGFLRQKQEGYFLLRTRMASGNFSAEQLAKFADLSKKYGRGIIHATTRQGLEVPFIRFEDIVIVEREAVAAGILPGTSGPRIRATTTCPGNNWCKSGLVDTFALFDKIEKEINIRCGMDLPHKFKIAISGCPNKCTRADASEIGIHGQVDTSGPERRIGYAVYLGGCGGKTPRLGFRLKNIFTADEVLSIIERVVAFYKEHAQPRQRLALLIEEKGKDVFLREIGL
jgi:dissimilatory sulfite reductase (desulfoviridin) alpha/beta subunit